MRSQNSCISRSVASAAISLCQIVIQSRAKARGSGGGDTPGPSAIHHILSPKTRS